MCVHGRLIFFTGGILGLVGAAPLAGMMPTTATCVKPRRPSRAARLFALPVLDAAMVDIPSRRHGNRRGGIVQRGALLDEVPG